MTTAGTPVHVDFRKWGGTLHWQESAVWLGQDEFGSWLFVPAGSHAWRPGASFDCTEGIRLVPDAPWVAMVNEPPPGPTDPARSPIETYVDLTTVPRWHDTEEGLRVEAVDLDLDVIRRFNGAVFIDDEDEFAEHQMTLGYPAEVVARTRATADAVHQKVRDGAPPFDAATSRGWLERGRALGLSSLPPVPGEPSPGR